MNDWVALDREAGLPVVIQDAATQIAGLQNKFARAGHYPTVDLDRHLRPDRTDRLDHFRQQLAR